MTLDRIATDPDRMGGALCIRDLRVTVSMVLGQLAGGRTIEHLLSDYPYLEREDVVAALEYVIRYRAPTHRHDPTHRSPFDNNR